MCDFAADVELWAKKKEKIMFKNTAPLSVQMDWMYRIFSQMKLHTRVHFQGNRLHFQEKICFPTRQNCSELAWFEILKGVHFMFCVFLWCNL